MVTLSFHEGEDRPIKQFFQTLESKQQGRLLTKRPLTPTETELQRNPRSRSTKLRAIEKIAWQKQILFYIVLATIVVSQTVATLFHSAIGLTQHAHLIHWSEKNCFTTRHYSTTNFTGKPKFCQNSRPKRPQTAVPANRWCTQCSAIWYTGCCSIIMKLATIRRASSRRSDVADSHGRQRILAGVFSRIFLICVRLGYWQIIRASELTQEAEGQYRRVQKQSGQRGTILFQDHKPLVINTQVYRWYSKPDLLSSQERDQIITAALPLYQRQHPDDPENQSTKDRLHDFSTPTAESGQKWSQTFLKRTRQRYQHLPSQTQDLKPTKLGITRGIDGSSHHWLCWKNADGQPTGYFGLEGALDQELDARSLSQKVVTDALGFLFFSRWEQNLDGRTFVTTLRRDVQQLLERENSMKVCSNMVQ